MTYTGYQDVTRISRPRSVEEVLDYAEHVSEATGRPLKHRELDRAASCAEKMRDLRAARARFADDSLERLSAIGLKFAAGKASAEDVLMEATRTASIDGHAVEVQRLTEAATQGINRTGLQHISNLTEAWWLAGLKASAAALLERAHQVADELDIKPRQAVSGIRVDAHPWAPSSDDLDEIKTRHGWELLEQILFDLDAVHSIADGLREMGIVPLIADRIHSEDYRWKHADRLTGDPSLVREFFLMNRANGEPGLFTAAELADTKPPQVRQLGVDSYSAGALALENATV